MSLVNYFKILNKYIIIFLTHNRHNGRSLNRSGT